MTPFMPTGNDLD